jgi:D-3-phosphoglycerate dehydrogenase
MAAQATPRIVTFYDDQMLPEQRTRLNSLGNVVSVSKIPTNGHEYLDAVRDADIICSVSAGFADAALHLHDVYVTFPFVSVAFADLDSLKRNNVIVSNAPGANRYAVAEWAICMVILLLRDFLNEINGEHIQRDDNGLPIQSAGLSDCQITILGCGNIGQRIAEIAKSFGADVRFFERGDDLHESVSGADVVINALSSNPSTIGLLDKSFFDAMKSGSYFVNVAREEIIDDDVLISALDRGHLAGAASDVANIYAGNTSDPAYQKLSRHPKIIATPHIAYSTAKSINLGMDIMIDNVVAYLDGYLQNLVN